jgi:hypothetical protein
MTPMLETQLTVDDISDFQRLLNTRPVGRELVKGLRRGYLSVLTLGGLICLAAWHTPAGVLFCLGTLVPVGIFAWFMLPKSLIRGTHLRALKTYPLGLLPPARLWLDELGLYTDSAGVRVHYAWGTIRGIDETPTHAFIWVSEAQTVILPRRNGELQVRAFVEALRAGMWQTGVSQQAGFAAG